MNCFKSRSKTSTDGGFTLIEILVVVIMVAILMGIAAPSWFAYLSRQRMRTVQNDLAEIYKQAQTDAKQLRSNQTVTIGTVAGKPAVQVNGVAKVLGEGNIKAGTITMTTASTSLSFDYQGMPEASKVPYVVTITPTGANAKRCVVVANLLGAVKTARDAQCNNVTATSVGSEN